DPRWYGECRCHAASAHSIDCGSMLARFTFRHEALNEKPMRYASEMTSCAVRENSQLHAVAHPQFGEDAPCVHLDRAHRDFQPLRYLAVGQALDHSHRNLELAFGEKRRPGAPACGQRVAP